MTLCLFLLEESLFDLKNVFSMAAARNNGLFSLLVWFLLLMACLFLNIYWIWVSLNAKPVQQFLLLALFCFGILIQYGYWNLLHRFFGPGDIALLGVTSTQSWADSFVLYFSWQGLVVCVPYIVLAAAHRKIRRMGWREFTAVILGFLALSITLQSMEYPRYVGTSFFNSFKSLTSYILDGARPTERQKVTYKGSNAPDINIVLVIDEGVRSDHIEVNGYKRDTAPWLVEIQEQGMLYSWGTASSGGTCSPLSNQLLITGVIPSVDTFKTISSAPTIFDYAKAAGYKSYYFDAQTNYLWNGLTAADTQYVQWINTNTLGNSPGNDIKLGESIREIIQNSTGNFIVANKRGVHFMYEDSYPESETIWGPLPPNQDYRGYPELVTNPYDNGIRYTTNGFFKALLPDATLPPKTWLIYTSDHGQTLFEDGMGWSHCNNSVKEASVPLIIIGPFSSPPDTSYPASHSNIFPTILELMGVPSTAKILEYNHSLLQNNNPHLTRSFINGASEIIPFDQ